jgi:hypothetical protein
MARLVKNGDGQWACSGPGTLNDAKGRTRTELGQAIADQARDASTQELAQELAQYDRGDV